MGENVAVLDTPLGWSARMRQAKAQHAAERRRSTLRRDFLDEPFWCELAQGVIRLPAWGIPCTPTAMEGVLGKLGHKARWYFQHSGEQKLGEFRENNPDWPLRAWVGVILEWHLAETP